MASPLFAGAILALTGTLVAPAPLTSAPAQPTDRDDVEIDFAALGMKVLERAGLADKVNEEIAIEDILEKSYLTVRLGLFDLGISNHTAADQVKGQDYIDLGIALLKLQDQFLDWLGDDAPGYKDAKKDITTLQKWLKSVRPGAIAGLSDKAGEISTHLSVKSKALEAQARFGDYMARGIPLGLDRADQYVEPFLVTPDRRDFLELLASFGYILPDQQGVFWTNDAARWTNTFFNDCSVVALEFADLGSTTEGAFGGFSMDSRTPTGMEQQITQLAGNALVDNLYGDKIPPSLAGAISVNLVTDIYGECNTRVDGDLSERRTMAREIFVPGGLSEGGILPPNMADSRWRTEQGSDRFINSLQASQSAGASDKKAGPRGTVFEIQDDRQASRMTLAAPFLGSLAAEKELIIPDEFYGDSLEFFRSYRSCFIHWLQTDGIKKSKKKSAAAFAEFMSSLAQQEVTDAALEETVVKIYEMPLSSAELDDKCLEGRFLKWLAKQ